MRILEYDALHTQRVSKTYRKVVDAIAKGDFAAAQPRRRRLETRTAGAQPALDQ